MDKKPRKRQFGVFFCEKPDGTITDKGIVNEMLQGEDRIRQELIDAGIIRQILVMDKNQKDNNED